MRYNKLLISVLAAACFISAPANANVGTGMQSWFDSMGGYSNATPPSSYKGQTMNGYSAGGFYARSPVKSYQLVQMTPPSLNIGCGGIDLTAGSFSFINKAAITALFQNIGTSISYAFLLAIKSSMPEMASLFEYLQDVANKVNGMNVNSCKMAEGIPALFGSDLSKSSSDMFGHVAGAVSNMLPDSYDAWKTSRDSAAAKRLAEDAAIALDPSKKDQYRPGNVVWMALSKSTGLDNEDKLFIMSMTGTIIIDPPNPAVNAANGGTSASWHYVDPTGVEINDFIGYNDGITSPINLFTCDTAVDCLHPTVGSIAVTPFINRIATKLDNLRNNVISRGSQTISDFKLVDASAIPVWKMISTSASVNPGFIDAYKRLIAVDVAYAYINNILKTAAQIMANSQNGSAPKDAQDALQKLNERLTLLNGNLQASRLAEYAKVQQEAQLERQIQLMHQAMVAGIPAQAFTSMTVFGNER
jgi:conjugative transfer pilus assembly protein TraH